MQTRRVVTKRRSTLYPVLAALISELHAVAETSPASASDGNCGIDRAGPTSIHADISLKSRLFSTKGNAMRKMLGLTALIGGLVAASTAQADITVGFVTSLSGPGSSIGIPYGRGIQAAVEYK